MAQFINEYRGLGETLGTGLGQGLGAGLNQLAQMKLNQVLTQQQARQSAKSYEKFGIRPQIAEALASLSPEERKYPLQNLGALLQLGKKPEQKTTSAAVEGLTSPETTQDTDENTKIIEQLFTSPHERREQEKLDLKKQDIGRKNAKEIREYLAPGYEKSEKLKANIRDYDALEKLAKQGNLRSGAVQQLLSKVGLEDLGANYSTQLANKIIARLAQNAGTAFGTNARITNYLERTFQRSIASLWNTKEGIIGISQINKLADQVGIKEQEIRRNIIKENKGVIPDDIEGEVQERLEPVRKKLEDQAMDVVLSLDPSRTVDKIPEGYKGRVRDTVTGKIINVGG